MSTRKHEKDVGKFKVGDPVEISGRPAGKIIVVVGPGENAKRVLEGYCDRTGTYLHLASEALPKDHESYIVQVGDSLCRLADPQSLRLDPKAVHFLQTADDRRKRFFRAEVIPDAATYDGDPAKKLLCLRVSPNGVEWSSVYILPREVRQVIRALESALPRPKARAKKK